jgi:hypothetical protein
VSLGDHFGPITEKEVENKIKKLRKKSAAGPDGLTKENLLIPGLPAILAKFFNMLWYSSCFPTLWKENRTTLIPKPNKDLSIVENWRPITIGPILSRMFSSILDGRLRGGITQNMRQKGFTSESGCKINIEMMKAALDHCKQNRGGVFTIVDISKAFDTIPHASIRPCLARKGIPAPIIEIIMKMYDSSRTTIKTKDNIGVEVEILRGVKQGDPLSPLLFNLCLEPLIENISKKTSGIKINNESSIPVLAFADDMVLLGEDEREAQSQVNELHRYLESLGMKISIEKSQTFQVVAKKDTWFIKNPEIKIGSNKIPEINPEEAFKYLGAKIGPWKGVHCGIIVPEILSMVRRVRKLSLKPCQKIDLLMKYIFPRFTYHLLTSPPGDGVLKLMDNEVRQEIKKILHLVPSTATGFFYALRNYGGSGLSRFEHMVKLGTLRSALKMKESADPAVASLINQDTDKTLKKIANSLRINWPATLEDINNAGKRLKGEHVKQWAELKSQGQGVNDFAQEKLGNIWLK